MTTRLLQRKLPGGILVTSNAARLSAIKARASSAHTRHSSSDKQAIIDILHASFRYEATSGLQNAQGREMIFSDFVTSKLEELLQHGSSNEDKIDFSRCLSGFRKYRTMKKEERQKHIGIANYILQGQPIRFPRLPYPQNTGRPAASPSSLGVTLQDRSLSNGQASSSRLNALESSDQASKLRAQENPLKLEGNIPKGSELSSDGGSNLIGSANGIVTEVVSQDAADVSASDAVGLENLTLEPGSGSKSKAEADEQKRRLREAFDQAAMRHWGQISDRRLTQQSGSASTEQGSAGWFALRESRMTASAFGNALGFWKDGRSSLWEEKIGIGKKFLGNDATAWGTKQEPAAIQRYKEVTGHSIDSMNFMIYGEGQVTSWLGASPDGLITPASSAQTLAGPIDAAGFGRPPQGTGPGVLEIKCPHNKGQPMKASPYRNAPYYYMPQVQGLMEIFDRDWCNLFCYTVNSAAVYHIKRDRGYWKDVYNVLADFWWGSVIPAKDMMASGNKEDIELFRPSEKHLLTDNLVQRSQSMAVSATTKIYPQNRQKQMTM